MPEDKVLKPSETRRFLNETLEEFRASRDPDSQLRSLQKISQLVEVTTDEELYELASATAVADDYRLRGEICYTILRSRRPQLLQILKEMVRDENPYVRRTAMTALGRLSGTGEAIPNAVNLIQDDVARLRSVISSLEDKITHLSNSIEKLSSIVTVSSKTRENTMDDYMRSWETYLRHEKELLRDHNGKYIAIYGEAVVGIGEDEEALAEMIYEKYGSVEALICKIEEEGEAIQMPPPRQIIA